MMCSPRQAIARLVSVALLLAAGCSTGGAPALQIGLQRVALDLAFREPGSGASPAPPALPTPPPAVQASFEVSNSTLRVPTPPIVEECPAAPSGTRPSAGVPANLTTPPVEGAYTVGNRGVLGVTTNGATVEHLYPDEGVMEIRNVEVAEDAVDVAGVSLPLEFDQVVPVGTTTTVTRYRATATTLELLRRDITSEQGNFSFVPTPAVQVMSFGQGEGASWTSAGTDLTTGATMTVEGQIVAREAVDVCGTIYDSYRVRSSERLVLLIGPQPFTQMTDDNGLAEAEEDRQPNFYNFAPHLGALWLRIETHRTTTTGDVVVAEDNISTLRSVTPTDGGRG